MEQVSARSSSRGEWSAFRGTLRLLPADFSSRDCTVALRLDLGGVRQLSNSCQELSEACSSGSSFCNQAAVDWNVGICGAVPEVALCHDYWLPLILPATLAGPTPPGA